MDDDNNCAPQFSLGQLCMRSAVGQQCQSLLSCSSNNTFWRNTFCQRRGVKEKKTEHLAGQFEKRHEVFFELSKTSLYNQLFGFLRQTGFVPSTNMFVTYGP